MSFDLYIVNGDLNVKNGDLETVSGRNKLIQDIMKICLTPAGASIYNPWYGSFINQTLIGSVLDSDITESIARNQLQNSIENLKKLQQIQASETLQAISLEEHLAAIKDISVQRNRTNLTLFDVVIKVLDRSFKQTTVNFVLSNT